MSLEEKVFFHMTINLFMGQLPLLGKDLVVFQDGFLNLIGSQQDFLMVVLSICFDPPDLGAMGSPLNFRIIDLRGRIS